MDYLNETIQFKFRFASTNSTARGWFLDNFTIYGATDFYVGVEDDFAAMTPASPQRYHLEQNVPNPFNPYTLISYQIPVAEHVLLRIYDSTGNLVRTLVNDEQPAGDYSVEWDGTSEHGVSLASGIYLYQLNSGNFSQTRRMIMLK